jgi:uncharacterized sporulation protein YeaH/YhbH (DUF444 family)
VGPESLRHFKRTYREALKRMIASGTFTPDNPSSSPSATTSATAPGRRSTEPVTNAVIIYMMDVSGSMGDEQKEIVRIESFWIDTWLTKQYKGLESRFIIHDAVAREVDRDTFFHTRESGGTMISSAYKLCAQIIEDDYPAASGTSTRSTSPTATTGRWTTPCLCVEILKKQIFPAAPTCSPTARWRAPTAPASSSRTCASTSPRTTSVVTSEIRDKDAIVGSIKDFLGKGK